MYRSLTLSDERLASCAGTQANFGVADEEESGVMDCNLKFADAIAKVDYEIIFYSNFTSTLVF